MTKSQQCSVKGCSERAGYEVVFYDFYLTQGEPFYERHASCPFICSEHLKENEMTAETGGETGSKIRQYRGRVKYKHTKSGGQGFCIYRPL